MEKNYYTNKFFESLELYLKMKMIKSIDGYLNKISPDDRSNVEAVITKKQISLEEINDLLIDYSPVEFDDSDLFSMVYQYFSSIVPWFRNNEELVSLSVSIKWNLRHNKYPDIPDFLYLPIIYYLIGSKNSYQELTRKLLGNNLCYFEENISGHDADFAFAHGDVFLMLKRLDTITTDVDYTILEEDYTLLSQLLKYSVLPLFEKESSVIKNILKIDFFSDDFDNKIKVFSHFLSIDMNIKKYNNKYLYTKEIFDLVDKPEITPELILFLQTNFANEFYHIPQLEHLYQDDFLFTFDQILSFLYKFEETGQVLPKEDLKQLLDKKLDSSLLPRVSSEFSNKIYSIYREYRKNKFEFNFKDFSSYMNSLDIDFSPFKYHGTKEFDFYMFDLFCQHSISSQYLPFYEALMKTNSGKILLEEDITRAKNSLRERETIFSTDTYQRCMPYAQQLAKLSDYTLDSFLLEFVPEEDHQKVGSLCTWLNPTYFHNSLFSGERFKANNKRLLRKKDLYFVHSSLKSLTLDKVEDYWKSFQKFLPYSVSQKLTKKEFFAQYREIYQKRIDDIAFDEVKNMSLFMKTEMSLLRYIDQADYLPEQALKMIDSTISKMPEEKEKLLVMKKQLFDEIKIREEEEKSFSDTKKYIEDVKNANKLLLLFFTSDFSSMAHFYQTAKEKFHISEDKQRKLLKMFLGSLGEESDISDLYEKKRELISLKQREKLIESTKQRAKERLEENIDLYGEKALNVMRKFVDSDDNTIGKFCHSAGISINDFRFYRKLCENVDSDVSILVDEKAANIRRNFIHAMAVASNYICKEMVKCHKQKVPYNLVKHYQKYGYSPRFIADIASSIARRREADNINKYLTLYPDIFVPISVNKLEEMRRVSRVYPGNIYFGDAKVSYNSKNLDYATQELNGMGIPITKGSLYYFLLDNKQKEKPYQKIRTEKKST